MRVYRSGVFHCVVGGFSFAAAIEVRERFHEQAPAVFCTIHGLVVLLLAAWLILLVRKGVLPLGRAVRDGLLIACCYAMAATGSVVAFWAIPAVAVFAFVMMTRGVGLTSSGEAEESDA